MKVIENVVQLETVPEGALFELMNTLYVSLKWKNITEDLKELVAYNLNNKSVVVIDDFTTSRYAVNLIITSDELTSIMKGLT